MTTRMQVGLPLLIGSVSGGIVGYLWGFTGVIVGGSVLVAGLGLYAARESWKASE